MIWERLKNMKCPVCNGFLKEKTKGYVCNCGFFCSKGKFDAIVNKMYHKNKRLVEDSDKNLSELNNL